MKFLRSTYHYLLSWLGSGLYKHPSRKLFVIGVTGTKGKSTVIELINAILEFAGKKTAERVILELRGKLQQEGAGKIVGLMESDQDIVEALANLGYTKSQAKDALARLDSKIVKMEERIKQALQLLKLK